MFVVVSDRRDLCRRIEDAFVSDVPVVGENFREFRWRLTCHDLEGITAVVLDVRHPDDTVLEMIDTTVFLRRHTCLFAVVSRSDVLLAGDLAHRGVDRCLPDDYLTRDLRDTLLDTFSRYRSLSSTLQDVPELRSFLIGQSRIMNVLRDKIRRVAATDEAVLITGETGVGKELVAQGIHRLSGRRNGPLEAINVTAVAETLFESEMYGVQKGSFTDARETRNGIFHAAHGGSVFLDEIGELAHSLQPKLLRALETGRVRRVGSSREEDVSVRVISATNRNLNFMVQAGVFRRDLWHRIAGLHIEVPPLRDHMEDIEEIAYHLLKRRGRGDVRLSHNLVRWFQRYAWPGNVRELNSIIGRGLVNVDGAVMGVRHIELDETNVPIGRAGRRIRGLREQGDLPGLLPG
jgi:DNA-binding NtrC family response regulator